MTYLHKMPWQPGTVDGVTTPATHEQLNAVAMWKRLSREDVAAINISSTAFMTSANDVPTVVFVAGFGSYRYDPASTLIHDNELVIAPSAGAGRWVLEQPGMAASFAYFGG